MELEETIEFTSRTICLSPAFAALKKAKEILEADSNSFKLLADFENKRNLAYSPNTPENRRTQLVNELNNDFTKLNQTPEFKNYFEASDKFNMFVGGLFDKIISLVRKNL